jgi:hypothetical protein
MIPINAFSTFDASSAEVSINPIPIESKLDEKEM